MQKVMLWAYRITIFVIRKIKRDKVIWFSLINRPTDVFTAALFWPNKTEGIQKEQWCHELS